MSVPVVSGVPVVDLVMGSTILLGSGVIAAAVARAPVHRQRAAELSVAATLLWLALALFPLPRWPAIAPAEGQAERRSALPAGAGAGAAAISDAGAPLPADGSSGRAGDARGSAAPAAAPQHFIRMVYVGVSLCVAAYALLGLLLIRRLLSMSASPAPWLATLFALRRDVLCVRRARLLIGGERCRPLSAGVLRPTVLVPATLADPRRETELRRVLDHELVHVRRRDVLGRVLFAVAAPLLWAHPLFWWLRARAALSAELIADDAAAGAGDRHAYARGLLALAEEIHPLRQTPGMAPGVFRNRSELTRRVQMLIEQTGGLATTCTAKRRAAQAAATLLAVGLCAGMLGARPAPAQERETGIREVETEMPGATPGDPEVIALSADRDVGGGEAVLGRSSAPPEPPAQDAAASRPRQAAREPTAIRQQQAAQETEQEPGYAATLALVDRVLTLRGELALAESEFAENKRLRSLGLADETGPRRAQLQAVNLHRRLEAVQILVLTEIEATKIELADLTKKIELGLSSTAARVRLVRLNARLKVLASALR